eukprot:5962890-Pyramimonas_sp.AAC.1
MHKDAYDPEAGTLTATQSAMDLTPDPTEQHLRLRLLAKSNLLQAIIAERIAKANNTRQQAQDAKWIEALKPHDQVDIWRTPARKDQDGWRGPAELISLGKDTAAAIVIHQNQPCKIPARHMRARRQSFWIRQLLG